jgi:hypothetical protein
MTSYTEGDIREAFSRKSWTQASAEELLAALKGDHVHDLADDDTITVRELRDLWRRGGLAYPLSIDALLKDVSGHREPSFLPGQVVRDADGVFWRYSMNPAWPEGKWTGFGSISLHGFRTPKRPLKVMS